MQSNQGPWRGSPPPGPRRPSEGGSREDRIKALLRSTEGAPYVLAEKPGPGFLDADARAQAERFAGLAQSQLRRFYGMVTGFKRRLELDGETRLGDNDVQAEMAYLKAAAAYAAMRNQPEELAEFFIKHANSVKTPAQFERFCRHFETVVAYHKVFGKRD